MGGLEWTYPRLGYLLRCQSYRASGLSGPRLVDKEKVRVSNNECGDGKVRTVEDAAIPWSYPATEGPYFAFLEGGIVREHGYEVLSGKGRTRLSFVGWYFASTPSPSVMIITSVYPQCSGRRRERVVYVRNMGLGGK